MSFTKGLAGVIGGLVIYVMAAVLFSSTQFIAPSLAALFMWVGIAGLAVTIFAPIYYWIGFPLYCRFHQAKA